MPAPIEARMTNLEALVAGIITNAGEDKDRAEARHRAVLDEFGHVHGKLDALDTRLAGVEAKQDQMLTVLGQILERLPEK